MQNDLAMSVVLYQRIKGEILARSPEIADDDEALLGTLEGETNTHEIIAALIRDARRAEAMANGLAEIIKDGQARKSRLESRSERLRKFAFDAMQECGIPKVESCDLTISIGKGVRRVIVKDDAAVPDELCKIERSPKLREIGALMDAGEFVGYAEWSNAMPVLRVKST
jgi:hypothetical protein